MSSLQIRRRSVLIALALASTSLCGCSEEAPAAADLAPADLSTSAPPDAAMAGLEPGPYSIVYSGSGGTGIDQRTPITAVVSASGDLDSWAFGTQSFLRGTSLTGERYADEYSLLGRWNGGSGTLTYTATQGFHYGLVVKPASAPTSGTINYTLRKATAATIDDGSLAVGTIQAKLAVAFGATTKKAGLELTIDMPGDGTYTGMTTGGVADPSQSAVSGTLALMAGDLTMTSSGVACAGGAACKASVRAYLGGGGNGTARAVVVFVLSSGGPITKVLRGALVFGS